MVGRPRKRFRRIYRPIIATANGIEMKVKEKFLIQCPICGSDRVGPNGTQKQKETRAESFQCKNL